MGANLHQFIFLDIFQGRFQAHFARRTDMSGVILAGGAHVGKLFGLDDIGGNIVILAVFADHLAFINLLARRDEEKAAVIQGIESVSGHLPRVRGDDHAIGPTRHRAAHGFIAFKGVVHNGPALRGVEHAAVQAEDAARGNHKFHMDEIVSTGFGVHFDQFAAAVTHQTHHGALAVGRAINHQ